jgi:hypothetical protein
MKTLLGAVAASVAAVALAGWAGTAQADNGGRTGNDSPVAAATSSGDPASTSAEPTTSPESGPGNDTTTARRCIQASPIVLSSTTASATFTIAAGCADMPVTLGVYLTRGAGFSMPQTLSQMTEGVFGPGSSHTLTVPLPGCFFQVDLMGVATPPSKLMTSADLAAQQTVEWAFGGSATACSTSTGGGSEEKPPATTGGGSTEAGGTQPVSVTATPAAPAATPPVVTPPATTPPATTPPATTPPATVPPAKHKVGATGGVLGASKTLKAAPHVAAAKATGTLPFTGMPIWIVALVGLGLMTVGAGLFRTTRSNV